LDKAGLAPGQLRVEAEAIVQVIENYAREAGVRKLEKMLSKIVRKAVLKVVRDGASSVEVTQADVENYLGPKPYPAEKRMQGVGIVTGLAWTPLGGATLNIEATRIHGFSRGFKLTGQLGDVMRESAEIACSYVVSNAGKFGINPEYFENATIHLHVPAGATPKDGPSAGIKEKILAARRIGIEELIVPEENRADYEGLSDDVVEGITCHFVSHFDSVYPHLFSDQSPAALVSGW